MATSAEVFRSSAENAQYEPFMYEGKETGEVSWLRTESGGEGMLFAGFWRAEPMTINYTFEGDETFQVMRGRVRIEPEGGQPAELSAGDVASFPKGLKAVWRVQEPFQKFFVISG
jgi:uncharacterized cupin superfamily protein